MTRDANRGPGETGGLPGANADPRTAKISEDERADTVSGAGTTPSGVSDVGDEGYPASNG